MTRWSGVASLSFSLLGVVALGGCAHRAVPEAMPAVTGTAAETGTSDVQSEPAAPAAEAVATAPLDVREIKLISDNGQQGLFVKLTRAPGALNHYTLAQPNRIVIDIAGAGSAGGEASAQKYTVDNPMISEVRVSRHDGQVRVAIHLKDAVPTYTVNDLNDTVVAFLGEPSGTNEPVREQVVFTRRAVETSATEDRPAGAAAALGQTMAATGTSKPRAATARAAGAEIGTATSGTATGGTATSGAATSGAAMRGSVTDEPADGDAGMRAGARQPYHGQHVSLDFKDADVHNVLRLLAEVSKLNIVATEEVHGKVTLRLFDLPWDQALDIVLQVLNLESEQEGNVIRISTVKRLREEREELQKAREAAKAVEPLHVDYIKVNYAKATKLADIISGAARSKGTGARPTTEEQGVLSNRGSVFTDEFSNTLIVRDIQRGIDTARELVRRLDVQTPQILIESNIVEATTDFSRDLGVQWGYQHSVGPQTGNPTGFNFPGTIGFGGSGLGTGSNGVPFIADFPAAVAPGSGSALDLALGSLDGSQSLNVRLTALESTGKARIISRPRVVTLNNVAATIKSLTIIRVKLPSTGTVINTGAGGAAGAASTATEKIETGIILVVTPQVSSDGYVLLDMFAKSSQADFTREVDNVPTEISREATSHVLVKEGQTVVLGGIYRDNTSQIRNGLPFLMDIPGFGWLFRSLTSTQRREDLLVFLTPRILAGASTGLPSAQELWIHRN